MSRDSFDATDLPSRVPGRVSKVRIVLDVSEVWTAGAPAVLDEDGVEITPAVAPELVRHYAGRYEYQIPDEAGGPADSREGDIRDHVTPTRKGHIKGLLDWAMDTANAHRP